MNEWLQGNGHEDDGKGNRQRGNQQGSEGAVHECKIKKHSHIWSNCSDS
jgi:hypothetical protein